MVFKRMLGAFGVGAPSVDTVLSTPRTRPGGTLEGEVRLKGGDFDAEIEHVTLGLVARVEIEHGDGESAGLSEFGSARVSGPFTLRKGEERTVDFRIPVPWETPISEIAGQPLRGMAVGVRTELAIAKAVDKGDLDMVAVEPLPSQLRILESFLQLGFAFKAADLEAGHLYGVRQELPFYQEIEFYPTGHYAGRVGEVEVTFVADPAGLEVVLEADKRTGRYSSSDAIGRFHVSHEDALRTDWAGELGRWLDSLSQYGGSQHGGAGFHGDHHYGGHRGHHGQHGQHGGPGMGAVVAAGAAGVVGGLVAGEVVEEVVEEFFEGGDEGGDW
ncbi:sporulation protein [Nonomuraea gerenzanensis]|uniref:Sporulation control protein Spo0M n=1 Tax=Nonomuraea gerenzanensis TaxID=93944 RepID=A0A1M4EJ32_9ACTN|nr:sporulation protein [Nonomuraea gerenzanensis]UBU10197.1 sporulation protein [Nonomuraea gerenzanensis]SBO98573.1 Sporulation control protein Spo0M [Nonomuraea gerenzanensis]